MNINPFAMLKITTDVVPVIETAIGRFDAEHKLQKQTCKPDDPDGHVAYSMDYQTYGDDDYLAQLNDKIQELDPNAAIEIKPTCGNVHQIRYDTDDLVWVYNFQTSKAGTYVTRNMTPRLGVLKSTANHSMPDIVVLVDKDRMPDWSKCYRLSEIHLSPFKDDAIAGYNLLVKYAADKLQKSIDKINSYKIER